MAMRIFTFILLLIILFFGISFAILNAKLVVMDYYFGMAQLPLSLLLGITLILGAIIGWLVGLVMLLKAKKTQRYLRKQLATVQKEIKNLHQIPLKGK